MTAEARFNYDGAVVFVAGGTSGINLGIAEAFARAGAVVGVGSRKQEKVDAAVSRLSELGPKAHGAVFDVRDGDAVAAALADFANTAGNIDVLISGAAGNFPATVNDMSLNGFKAVVDIDLIGTFNVVKAAYPHLRKPGASVINITAPQAQIAMSHQAHVCAAKAGVDMLTRCLAIEWGPEGIRTNGVVPGPIDGTEGMDRLAPTEAIRNRVIDQVPAKRLGSPQDVASACLYLGSDTAAYVNGVILAADGGWLTAGARF